MKNLEEGNIEASNETDDIKIILALMCAMDDVIKKDRLSTTYKNAVSAAQNVLYESVCAE